MVPCDVLDLGSSLLSYGRSLSFSVRHCSEYKKRVQQIQLSANAANHQGESGTASDNLNHVVCNPITRRPKIAVASGLKSASDLRKVRQCYLDLVIFI